METALANLIKYFICIQGGHCKSEDIALVSAEACMGSGEIVFRLLLTAPSKLHSKYSSKVAASSPEAELLLRGIGRVQAEARGIPCSVDSAEFPYTVLKTH